MPRFEVRHTNGYWKLFDTHTYMDVAIFDALAAATRECANRNRDRSAK